MPKNNSNIMNFWSKLHRLTDCKNVTPTQTHLRSWKVSTCKNMPNHAQNNNNRIVVDIIMYIFDSITQAVTAKHSSSIYNNRPWTKTKATLKSLYFQLVK